MEEDNELLKMIADLEGRLWGKGDEFAPYLSDILDFVEYDMDNFKKWYKENK